MIFSAILSLLGLVIFWKVYPEELEEITEMMYSDFGMSLINFIEKEV